MRLKFEGKSDDTFGEYNCFNDDYDNCANGESICYAVTAPDGEKLLVFGQYCPLEATGWMIGVARANDDDDDDDDKPIPKWPMYIEHSDHAYSPILNIHAPEGTRIKHVPNKK